MATKLTFYNPSFDSDLTLTVDDDKAIENLQALVTLGFEPRVSVE